MKNSNSQLYLWSITAALAGFLFGFDTVVISGAEQRIQELWGLTAGTHGLAISMAPGARSLVLSLVLFLLIFLGVRRHCSGLVFCIWCPRFGLALLQMSTLSWLLALLEE